MLGLIQAMVVSSWFFVLILFSTRLKVLVTTPKTAILLNYISGGIFLGFGASLASTKL